MQPPQPKDAQRATLEHARIGGTRPGDIVRFVIDPVAYLTSGTEQLALLATPQPVSSEGTIQVPYVGPVQAQTLTERELTVRVSRELRTRIGFEGDLRARIIPAR